MITLWYSDMAGWEIPDFPLAMFDYQRANELHIPFSWDKWNICVTSSPSIRQIHLEDVGGRRPWIILSHNLF